MYVACRSKWIKHVVFRSPFEQIPNTSARQGSIKCLALIPPVAQRGWGCLVQQWISGLKHVKHIYIFRFIVERQTQDFGYRFAWRNYKSTDSLGRYNTNSDPAADRHMLIPQKWQWLLFIKQQIRTFLWYCSLFTEHNVPTVDTSLFTTFIVHSLALRGLVRCYRQFYTNQKTKCFFHRPIACKMCIWLYVSLFDWIYTYFITYIGRKS